MNYFKDEQGIRRNFVYTQRSSTSPLHGMQKYLEIFQPVWQILPIFDALNECRSCKNYQIGLKI